MVCGYGIWKPKNVLAQLKSSAKFWSWVPMQMLIQKQNKICKEHSGLHPNSNIKINFWSNTLYSEKESWTSQRNHENIFNQLD